VELHSDRRGNNGVEKEKSVKLRFKVVLAKVVVVSLLGCGKPPEAEGPKTPADEPKEQAAEPGAPDVPWEEKSHQQRLEYMGTVVYPKMKEMFQAHDPESYAEFTCATCHGDDMEAVNYEMPNTLIGLPADNPVEDSMGYAPETAKFMVEKVVPTMAELLDHKPFDPATGEGFDCFECHQKD
jgi:hypothetical protein